MSLQFTVNSLASFFVLLVPSQEHSLPWSLLAAWERVAVPQPTLCIRPSFATLSSPIDPLTVMLFRQFAYRAVAECYSMSDDIIPRLGFGIPPRPKQASGAILDLSSPTLYLFSFISRSYMIFWVVFSLFLIAHSSFFLTFSNPGLASLSCTVKTKLLWHSPEWPKICCFLAVSYLFKNLKRGD